MNLTLSIMESKFSFAKKKPKEMQIQEEKKNSTKQNKNSEMVALGDEWL